MSLFNDTLKKITLKELFSFIILLFIIQFFLNFLNIVNINYVWIYVGVIFYFIFKFRKCFESFKNDFYKLFSINNIKTILYIVVLNILLSYGLLYLSTYILSIFPDLNNFIEFSFSSLNLNFSLIGITGFISTVLISPISEELIFRGVLFNRLKFIVPTFISVLITSLLFASMHGFGSIIAAFVFGLCMSILYIKTDNILVPISAHFLNNFIAETIVILDSTNILFNNNWIIVFVSILSVVSAILIFISLNKELNNIKL